MLAIFIWILGTGTEEWRNSSLFTTNDLVINIVPELINEIETHYLYVN